MQEQPEKIQLKQLWTVRDEDVDADNVSQPDKNIGKVTAIFCCEGYLIKS